MNGTYQFAGQTVQICSIYDTVHRLCKDYRSDGSPVILVETVREDIDYEREKSAMEDILEGREARTFSDGYLETLAVYRKIVTEMLTFDTFLFHGSAVAVDGQGYLFTAKSGTGKSTHVRLWKELFGSRAVIVNDDKPLIRLSESGASVCGTPWDGKHRLSRNMIVPLKAICLLERSTVNQIRKITGREAYSMLLQQTYRPAGAEALKATLQLVDRLAASVQLYRLGCNMDPDAARVSSKAMLG